MTMPAPQDGEQEQQDDAGDGERRGKAQAADEEVHGGGEQIAEEPGDEQGDDDALRGLEHGADGDDGEDAERQGGGVDALRAETGGFDRGHGVFSRSGCGSGRPRPMAQAR